MIAKIHSHPNTVPTVLGKDGISFRHQLHAAQTLRPCLEQVSHMLSVHREDMRVATKAARETDRFCRETQPELFR